VGPISQFWAYANTFSPFSACHTEFPLPFEFAAFDLAASHTEETAALPPGAVAALHVASGCVNVTLNGGAPQRLEAEDALLFHADVAHSFFNPGLLAAMGYLVIVRKAQS